MIRDGIAKAYYLTAWFDREQECGRTYPGQEISEVAPEKIPEKAYDIADALLARIEELNGAGLDADFWFRGAMIADLQDRLGRKPTEDELEEAMDADTEEQFGWYTAMEAMGHGVSWSDDHVAVPLFKVPYFDAEIECSEMFWSEDANEAFERTRKSGRKLHIESRNDDGFLPYDPVDEDDDQILSAIGYKQGVETVAEHSAFLKLAMDYDLVVILDGRELDIDFERELTM